MNLLISTYLVRMVVFPFRNVVLRVLLLTTVHGRCGTAERWYKSNFFYNLQECDMHVDIWEYVFPCIY